MTNLLATIVITLITNTVENHLEFARYQPIPCPDQQIGCLVYHTQGFDPTKKEVVTTVRELKVCTFEWAGKIREVSEERIVSEERKILKLEWVTVKPEPPMPPWLGVIGVITNSMPRMIAITNGPEPSFVYQTNRGKLIWNH